MLNIIADILNAKLANLVWIEARSGMTVAATKTDYAPITMEDGTVKMIALPPLVYPVACGTSYPECWDNGKYKHLTPDENKGALAFFVDPGGVSLKEVLGPKAGLLRFQFRIKFLLWLNLRRLLPADSTDCNLSGRVAPYLAAQFYGDHTSSLPDVYRSVRVDSIQQLGKDPSMFKPYTFADNGAVFLYPYDYLGMMLSGTFDISRNCLPDFMGEDFTFNDGTCVTDEQPYLISEQGAVLLDESGNPLIAE